MSSLVTTSSIRELFKLLVEEASNHQRIELGEFTEFYLVNLLSEFVTAERLFNEEEDGKKDHEPLALMYHRAQQQSREEQIKTFRRMGDVSLYKVGFFADALRGGAVGPDYYIQMGGAAYGRVADLAPGGGFAAVYRELCEKFRPVVDVLEEIAARGLVANGPVGTLRVYETWVRTGNDKLERVLVDAGMLVPKDSELPN
jgi:hypothetical protein